MRRIVIGIITAVVIGILFVVLCTFVARPYETILLVRFGKLVPEQQQTRLMYHWFLKMPTDNVVRIDKRLHLFPGTLQEVTAGKEAISIRTFAAWRIVDPEKFYRTINASDDTAMKNLDAKISGLVHAKLATHTLDELFNPDEKKVHTTEIEREVAKEATNGSVEPKSSGMLDQGIEVVEVGFSRMAFPPSNANYVYGRMVEELKRQAIAFNSQGEAEAKSIRAKGEEDAQQIRSEAIVKADAIRGEGDQQALKILNNVQQSAADRDFYQYWKSLDFLKTVLTRNTIFVLPSDTDWLKSLTHAPPNGTFTIPATQPTPDGTRK